MDIESTTITTLLRNLIAKVDRIDRTISEVRQLVGPFGLVMPDGSILVQTIHSIKLHLDAMDSVMTPQLVIYRQWEPDISNYIVTSMTPETVFVDVGANVGYFTCLAGSRIGNSGTGKIIAVEPNPPTLRHLRKNVRINWSMCPIRIVEAAAADALGEAFMAMPTDSLANARVSENEAENGSKIIKTTLDEILKGEDRVDIIKLDIEGFEYFALAGATSTIARFPYVRIMMEWSPEQMRACGTSVDMALALFDSLGLMPHHIPTGLAEPIAIDHSQLRSTDYGNILLLPKAL